MKLVLGAVQFGVDYGVANSQGMPSMDVAFETLDEAWCAGIRILDSAQGYGCANKVLSAYHSRSENRFKIINKVLRHPPHDAADIDKIVHSLTDERQMLEIDAFECVMFHYAFSVNHVVPDDFFSDLKRQGITRENGLSISSVDEYKTLSNRFCFDTIQLPLNILNAAFFPDSFLEQLAGRKIFIRSAFLQGLLINRSDEMPSYLRALKSLIDKFKADCSTLDISPIVGCLLFLLEKKYVDYIVVGAQNRQQMQEIVAAYKDAEYLRSCDVSMNWKCYQSTEFDLVNPPAWPLKG